MFQHKISKLLESRLSTAVDKSETQTIAGQYAIDAELEGTF